MMSLSFLCIGPGLYRLSTRLNCCKNCSDRLHLTVLLSESNILPPFRPFLQLKIHQLDFMWSFRSYRSEFVVESYLSSNNKYPVKQVLTLFCSLRYVVKHHWYCSGSLKVGRLHKDKNNGIHSLWFHKKSRFEHIDGWSGALQAALC